MVGLWLPPFDASRDFKAIRFFRLHGRILERNADFPDDVKESIGERKLRQLYETRFIAFRDEEQVRQIPPAAPDPLDRDRDGRRGGSPAGADSSATIGAGRKKQAAVDALIEAHSQKQLYAMAKDLEGVHPRMNKTDLATAIVEAGDGTA